MIYRKCRSVAWPLALSVNILSQCICLSTDDALVTYWGNDPKVDVFCPNFATVPKLAPHRLLTSTETLTVTRALEAKP